MTEVESETARLRAFRTEAEAAAEAVETAWKLAGLPSEPNVMPVVSGRGLLQGPHVSLGGCSSTTAQALADVLTEYARLTGRLIDGESRHILATLAATGVIPALPGDGVYVVSKELSA